MCLDNTMTYQSAMCLQFCEIVFDRLLINLKMSTFYFRFLFNLYVYFFQYSFKLLIQPVLSDHPRIPALHYIRSCHFKFLILFCNNSQKSYRNYIITWLSITISSIGIHLQVQQLNLFCTRDFINVY